MSLGEIRGSAPENLVLLLEQLDPLGRLTQRVRLAADTVEPDDRAEFFSSIASQRFRHDGEMPKSFATWAIEASESR